MLIGIDLGGTKIEGIALSADGEELFRERMPTPAGEYQATLQVISELVSHIESTLNEKGSVGICTPGAISPATGLLKNSNSVCMNAKPVYEDLSRVLNRDIRIANDANCFALSEATDGAAAGEDVVFGVIVGTGTGAGVVVKGHVLDGPNAIAGEWGHNPLPWPRDSERPGPVCYCGKHGCIETWLSGPGMSRDYLDLSGQTLGAEQIVALTGEGEEAAHRCRRQGGAAGQGPGKDSGKSPAEASSEGPGEGPGEEEEKEHHEVAVRPVLPFHREAQY